MARMHYGYRDGKFRQGECGVTTGTCPYGNHSESREKIDDLREYVAGALYEDPSLGATYEKVASREGGKNVTSDMLIREGVPAKLAKIWANEPVSAEYARPDNEKPAAESATMDEESSEMVAYKEDVKRNPEKYLPERYADLKAEGMKGYLKTLREELQEREESGDTDGAKWTQGLVNDVLYDYELRSEFREMLVEKFESGAMRPAVDSDWIKWQTAAGLSNIEAPDEDAIFVENVDGVKIPPLTGRNSIDFMLSDKINIYEHTYKFFEFGDYATHIKLYGWSENGREPVALDVLAIRDSGWYSPPTYHK